MRRIMKKRVMKRRIMKRRITKRRVTARKRGPKSPFDGQLILPYGESDGGGFVVLCLKGRKVTVELTPVRAELVNLLNKSLRADQNLPLETRGWRAPEQIISALRYPVEETSLRRSVSNLNRHFRKATSKQAPRLAVRSLFGTKRKVGIRLNWLLEPYVPAVNCVERSPITDSHCTNDEERSRDRNARCTQPQGSHHRLTG
jgi:hypothetical protein